VITFISAGTDLTNALTQATEFGVEQRLTTSSLYVNTVKAVGLEMVQGLISSDAYYWDQSPEAAEWSKRFMARHSLGNAPTAIQIGVYSGVRHYLQAIKTAGTADREAALAALRAAPVNDAFVKDGFVREDGLMLHSQLILQAKTPEESTGDWDVFNVLRVVPAEDAYSPLSKSECSLVTKAKQ
jgi:branched-chain amino acid transport system substrate-binding protein